MRCPKCNYKEGFTRIGIGEFEQELLFYEGEGLALESEVITNTLKITAVRCSECGYEGPESEFTPKEVSNVKPGKDTKDTVRYLLGRDDEEEAAKVLSDLSLGPEEVQQIINESNPMTSEEAVKYISST